MRFVFGTGDYVLLHGNRIGRVDHSFIFDVFDVFDEYRHIFIVLTELSFAGTRDAILDLDVFQEANSVIVGITAIEPVKLYMVPVRNVGIVRVDWDVHYL